MSHIVAFSITGLAGRKEVYAQTLDRYVNVFFGLNGSGKTSLLKILHSAMSRDAQILKDVPFTSAKVKVYSIQYDREFTLSIDKQTRKPTKKAKIEPESTEVVTSFQEYISHIAQLKVAESPDSVDPIFKSVARPARQSDRHNPTVARVPGG